MKTKTALMLLAMSFLAAATAYAHAAMDRFWGEVPVDMLITGDVLVVKTLTVPEGVTLTIAPGTIVRFEKSEGGNNRIVVKGKLVAAGMSRDPIRFIPKSKDSGPWYGIEFIGEGRGTLVHCVVEGASHGVVDPGGHASLKDVTKR